VSYLKSFNIRNITFGWSNSGWLLFIFWNMLFCSYLMLILMNKLKKMAAILI